MEYALLLLLLCTALALALWLYGRVTAVPAVHSPKPPSAEIPQMSMGQLQAKISRDQSAAQISGMQPGYIPKSGGDGVDDAAIDAIFNAPAATSHD